MNYLFLVNIRFDKNIFFYSYEVKKEGGKYMEVVKSICLE